MFIKKSDRKFNLFMKSICYICFLFFFIIFFFCNLFLKNVQFQLTSNQKNSHIKYLGIKGLSCTETMQSQHKQIKYPAVIRKHLR